MTYKSPIEEKVHTSVEMLSSRITKHKFNGNTPSKFITVIFTLSRFSGVFPFKLSSKNHLKECNGLLYIIFPLMLTLLNVALLLKNFVHFTNEQYFTTIVQVITHVNTITYIFLPFFNRTRIQIGINTCLKNAPELNKDNIMNPISAITVVFIGWIFVGVLPPIIEWDLVCFLLYLEKFILGLLEVQLCFLLYHCNAILIRIREEIKDRKEVYTLQNFSKRFQSNIFCIDSLENAINNHFNVYKSMDNLNRAYGLTNFFLTIRERFSFAFHLYCWITNGRIFDLMLASANFFKMFLVFYSFQALKNEERELKQLVNELDSEVVNSTTTQMECLKKQIRLLDIKFDACGLFSMDLNMIISIVTTTAGYLLLLNQLNL